MTAPLSQPVPPPAAPSFDDVTREFGVGSVMSRTFSVWKKNFLSFTAVSLLLHSPSLGLTVALGAPVPGQPMEPTRLFATALSAMLGLVVTGALTYGVLQSMGGRPVRFGELLGVGFRSSFGIFLVSFAMGLIVLLGTFLLVVPGVIAMCALWLAVPAFVVEPIGVGGALRRSRELTKGYRLKIFLVFLLFWLLAMAVGGVAGLLGFAALTGGGGAGATAFVTVTEVLSIVAAGLFAAAPAVAYHDLRVLKEGVDTAQLAAVFD